MSSKTIELRFLFFLFMLSACFSPQKFIWCCFIQIKVWKHQFIIVHVYKLKVDVDYHAYASKNLPNVRGATCTAMTTFSLRSEKVKTLEKEFHYKIMEI